MILVIFFFSSRRRHTRYWRDWSSDVCSSDLWASPRTTRPETPSPCAGPIRVRARWRSWRATRVSCLLRSEERRVGKEGRSRWLPSHLKKKHARLYSHSQLHRKKVLVVRI